MNSSTLSKKLYHLSLIDFPVFYVSLDNWLKTNALTTGNIVTNLDLSDGDKVLLVNDLYDPIVSALATVYRQQTTIEGIDYRFSFSRTDVGVPCFCS